MSGALSMLAPLVGRLADLPNPILVKEVRQALRGRFFRICLVCVLLALTIASTAMVLNMAGSDSRHEGQEYFISVYVCLAVAVLGLVPFAAFQSMGAEWDENTFDLLVISNMRPRQIVGGKLLSALTQNLLFFATFTPYLCFGFLLEGVGLEAVLLVLFATLVGSTVLCILAIMASTLSRVRFARVVLMAALAVILFFANMGAVSFAAQVIENPADFFQRDAYDVMGGFLIGILLAGAFLFMIACNMLAHPEENRSTNVRVLTSLTLLAGIGFFHYILERHPDRDAVSGTSLGLLSVLLVAGIFFTTEHDALGRRVEPRVPRTPGLGWLVSPFLPGGARGVLYLCLHLAVIALYLLLEQRGLTRGSGASFFGDGVASWVAASAYGVVYLLLPAGLLAPFTSNGNLRAVVRVLIPFLVIVFVFAPALLGFFLDDRSLQGLEHPGNPFHLIVECWDQGAFLYPGYWVLLALLLTLAAALNAPRVARSFIEVGRARRRRVALEARRAGPAGSGAEDAVAGA